MAFEQFDVLLKIRADDNTRPWRVDLFEPPPPKPWRLIELDAARRRVVLIRAPVSDQRLRHGS
jgi:hypothetical protein